MNIYEFPPIRLLLDGAYWLVTTLSDLLEPLAGANGAALAVIVLTIAVRCLLIPVGLSQVRAGITRRRLAPKIAELQAKHKSDPQRMQEKLMELYREEKASPFAGCLPVLAQTPVLMAVYGLFVQATIGGAPNELLGHTLFGIPLSSSLVGLIGSGGLTWVSGLLFAVLIVLIGTVAALSRHLLTPPLPETAPTASAKGTQAGAGTRGGQGTAPAMPDLSGMTRILSFMPFITAVIAAFVPLAATLYLMTTTTWTLCERLVINRALGVDHTGAPRVNES